MSNASVLATDDPWGGCFPLDPAFRDDPYTPLARLRERDPVNRTPLGIWRLLRHEDVVRVLHDIPTGVRTTDGTLPGVVENETDGYRTFMLQQDPPNHTRLRRLVSHAFTPRAINALRPAIERVVTECLDRMADRTEIDLIADLALPVPSTVICEMMGVPLADREKFTVWTAQATHGLATMMNPPEVLERARAAAMSLAGYFVELIAERRTRLTDDLLSTLIRAEEDGDRLSPEELISQSIGLLIAGFETTIGLIGNGMRALLQHPDQLALLRAEPGLINSAVEECLRYDGPITLTVRVLHADAEFGGQTLPCNTMVMAMLASANRDPAVFPDPDRFDVKRTPNDHMAFGGGAHFCLGAHLARMEAQAAIGAFVQRFPRIELMESKVEWGPSLFRVPGRLPLRLGVR